MRTSDALLQQIGATFAVHYHTTLVKAPETLAALYTPSAHVVHRFEKANGAAELSSLLTSLTAEGLTGVRLEDVMAVPTTSGAIKVTMKGQFVSADNTQSFTQEVELSELEKNTYGIKSDKLSYSAVGQTAWAAETPVLKAAAEPASADVCETAAPAPAADATANPPADQAAARAPAANKKPASFAEALRLNKASEGAPFSNTAVRVTDKVKGAGEKGTGKGAKKDKAASPSAASAKPKPTKKAHSTPDSVIYYDIILKELPASTTEEKVRAVVTPVAAVKLVNIVKSEKRRRSKEAASETITFAFVQLERPVDAAATYVKNVVAKLTEMNKEMRIEEVREKPASAGARRTREGAAALRKKEVKA
ncbi:Nuclear transport factor 2 (NTF2) domain family protein [Leishmania donovani]|uniref:Nuclear transport factor 2 (NTF2) domain family protein n=1 Tax=Leishmania donovani TaxID=5661 RepID=A0A504Y1I3_LEIDO|nr:Nuclear transport factor 2 (NTF2) domain family protein [Leishmania donovani]